MLLLLGVFRNESEESSKILLCIFLYNYNSNVKRITFLNVGQIEANRVSLVARRRSDLLQFVLCSDIE